MADKLLFDLFQAYYDARRYKRNSINALEFEINYEQNLFQLYHNLKSGTYQIGRSVAFVVFNSVQREIIASPFRDRIIHHLVFNYINPIFEANFINDSYSCRVGKGTSYGIKRISHFVRSASSNYQKNCFILKLDLAGYFMSINQRQLYDKIKSYLLKNKKFSPFDLNLILRLIQKIIFHNYTDNCIIRGDGNNWRKLPANKSLFFVSSGFGLPIGNLTSQLFSNIYLYDFDHFIKMTLKFKYYSRYVDDFIIIDDNKDSLRAAMVSIKKYLVNNLILKLRPKKIYLQHCTKGVNFLGAIIKPQRIYIRNRTKNNFYLVIVKINGVLKNNNINKLKLLKILASINSYLGMTGQYKTYYLRRKILIRKLAPIFWYYFKLAENKDKYKKVILKKAPYSL